MAAATVKLASPASIRAAWNASAHPSPREPSAVPPPTQARTTSAAATGITASPTSR